MSVASLLRAAAALVRTAADAVLSPLAPAATAAPAAAPAVVPTAGAWKPCPPSPFLVPCDLAPATDAAAPAPPECVWPAPAAEAVYPPTHGAPHGGLTAADAAPLAGAVAADYPDGVAAV